MRNVHVVLIAVALALAGCGEAGSVTDPTTPILEPDLLPPRLTFPSINVGEPVRFQFTAADYGCTGGGGRCKSYIVTPAASGQLDVVLRSVSGDPSFTRLTELYVVPGADDWLVEGAQLTATLPAVAGTVYEIRLYSPVVPSVDLELLATLTSS